eukprot:sb/3479468/
MVILVNLEEYISYPDAGGLQPIMLYTKVKICIKLIPSPIGPNGSLESPRITKKITKNPRWLSWVFGPRPFSCIFSDMVKNINSLRIGVEKKIRGLKYVASSHVGEDHPWKSLYLIWLIRLDNICAPFLAIWLPLRNGLETFHRWCHFVGNGQVMGGRRRTFKLLKHSSSGVSVLFVNNLYGIFLSSLV